MKNRALIVVILLLTIFTVACSQETSSPSKQVVQNTNQGSEDKTSSTSPDFVKDKVFKGGSESTDYTLNGIRKRPNSTATRIHLNFGITGDDTKPGEPPILAKTLPLYEISYLDSEQKIIAIFDNVKLDVSEDKVQMLKDSAPIVKDLNFEIKADKLHVVFTLDQTVTYKILEQNDPAGISIFIKADE